MDREELKRLTKEEISRRIREGVKAATHPRGPRVTVGRRITCYDVYPSPTHDRPRPCPEPGGGRP